MVWVVQLWVRLVVQFRVLVVLMVVQMFLRFWLLFCWMVLCISVVCFLVLLCMVMISGRVGLFLVRLLLMFLLRVVVLLWQLSRLFISWKVIFRQLLKWCSVLDCFLLVWYSVVVLWVEVLKSIVVLLWIIFMQVFLVVLVLCILDNCSILFLVIIWVVWDMMCMIGMEFSLIIILKEWV